MNNENEMNEEVRQLLDSMEEHGRNAKRQQRLGDLIDQLDAQEKTVETPSKRRTLTPLWWVMGAAAAVLLFWLLFKPNMKQASDMEEQNLVEKVETTDSIKAEANNVVIEEPIVVEELLAEETPAVSKKTPTKAEKSKMEVAKEMAKEPVLAEIVPTDPISSNDTEDIGSDTISTVNEEPSTIQKSQRRVIRSLNLVCFECQKESVNEYELKPDVGNRTLFGQPQDPNMKNGSLALEFKFN